MGLVDQVSVTMKIVIIDSVDEDDKGDNDVDENVGDGDPYTGLSRDWPFHVLNYQSARENFPRC